MIFHSLYLKVLAWADKPKAPYYLGAISFAESSFFPVPVDVMLAPMVLARPKNWINLAFITTICSVLGGIAGFYIGVFFLDTVAPLLDKYGYMESFNQANTWFKQWGVWVVFLAGFSPIPYKVFTIASGALGMALLPFIIASFFGRAARFFLVALVVYLSAGKIKALSPKWVERFGWSMVVLAVIVYLFLR